MSGPGSRMDTGTGMVSPPAIAHPNLGEVNQIPYLLQQQERCLAVLTAIIFENLRKHAGREN